LAREDATRAQNIKTLIERGVLTPPSDYDVNADLDENEPISHEAEKVRI
jgi:hypothetical protein